MSDVKRLFLPTSEARGEGNHAEHGGRVSGAGIDDYRETFDVYGSYPSTTLRVVPLPLCDGEERS